MHRTVAGVAEKAIGAVEQRSPSVPDCGLLHNLRLLLQTKSMASLDISKSLLGKAVQNSQRDSQLVLLSLEVTQALPRLHAASSRDVSSSSSSTAPTVPEAFRVDDEVVQTTDELYRKTLRALAVRGDGPQQAFSRSVTSRLLSMSVGGDSRFFWHHFVSKADDALPTAYFRSLNASPVTQWEQGCAIAVQALHLSPAAGIAMAHRVALAVPCSATRSDWLMKVQSASVRLVDSPFFKPYGGIPSVDPLRVAAAARRTGGHWSEVLSMLQSVNDNPLRAVGVLRRLHNGHGSKWRTALMPLFVGHSSAHVVENTSRTDDDGRWTSAWEQALLSCPRVMLSESTFAASRSKCRRVWVSKLIRYASEATDQKMAAAALKAAFSLSGSLTSREELAHPDVTECLTLGARLATALIQAGTMLLRSTDVEPLLKSLSRCVSADGNAASRPSQEVLKLIEALRSASKDTPIYFLRAVTAAMPLLSSAEVTWLFASTCCELRKDRQSKTLDEAALNRHLLLLPLCCPPDVSSCLAAGLDECLEAVARLEAELVVAATCMTGPQHRQRGIFRGLWLGGDERPSQWLQFTSNVVLGWNTLHGGVEKAAMPDLSRVKSALYFLLKNSPPQRLNSTIESTALAVSLLMHMGPDVENPKRVGDRELIEAAGAAVEKVKDSRAHLALLSSCVAAHSRSGCSVWATATSSFGSLLLRHRGDAKTVSRGAGLLWSAICNDAVVPSEHRSHIVNAILDYLPSEAKTQAMESRKRDADGISFSGEQQQQLLTTQYLVAHVAASRRVEQRRGVLPQRLVKK